MHRNLMPVGCCISQISTVQDKDISYMDGSKCIANLQMDLCFEVFRILH